MPRIIMKSPYIKPNSKTHIGNYISYIATRDGVEMADSTLPSPADMSLTMFLSFLVPASTRQSCQLK